MLHDAVRKAVALAPGADIVIRTADGKQYKVTSLSKEEAEAQQNASAKELVEVDQQVRATASVVAGLVDQVREMMLAIQIALDRVNAAAEGQARFAESADNLAETLRRYRFVEPVYDTKGQLIGAERVETLSGSVRIEKPKGG